MQKILTIAEVVWLEMLRRKDLYVLLILMGALLFYLLSMDVFGLSGAVRYVKDVGLLLAWVFSWVLVVGLAGRQLPREEKSGTIQPLLAKPISRAQLLLGKWAGAWFAAAFGTALLYGVIVLVVVLRGSTFEAPALLQAGILHMALLGLLAAMALAFSTRMNFDAAACLTFFAAVWAFFVVPRIPEMVSHEEGFRRSFLMVVYYLLPHFELFDMRQRVVHEWGPAPWGVWFSVLAYAALWIAVFLFLGWFSYRNKRFGREAIG